MTKKINIAAAFFMSLFVFTAVLTVAGQADGFNHSLMVWVHAIERPFFTLVLKIITYSGEWFVYAPVALLLVIIPKLRRKFGIPSVITLTASALLNELLKYCFAIARPNDHRLITATGFGFPSGHAMNGAAFIGICALLFARYTSNRSLKTAVSISAGLFITAVGFSRVYLGVHRPTEIIAGYAMGFFLCLCAVSVIDTIQNRKSRGDPCGRPW